jgi:Lecithin:cholesterol acyltransferase
MTLIVVCLTVFSGACIDVKKTPNLAVIFAKAKTQEGKRPVIIIPGVLGSELVNAETQEKVWLSLSPSRGDGLGLPVSPVLENNRDSLRPRQIIEKAKIFRFFPDISVYQSLTDSMKEFGGYKEGDWDNPAPTGDRDTYYVFAYDWRRDNVENARLLITRMAELQQKLKRPDLRFNIIAHSMGGLIARYAAMYGNADLPTAGTPVPTWAGAKYFNKIFMFGTPNEGSMAAFQTVLKGYSIPALTGKISFASLSSEVAFTSPALYQLLPHQISAKFYDENLKPIDVDLYNTETWKKYGWGPIARPEFLSRFKGQPGATDAKTGKPSEYAETSLDDLNGYFAAVLKRAKEFEAALDADTAVPATISFFAFGSDCSNTLNGAIIGKDPKTGSWVTTFSAKDIKTADGGKTTAQEVRNLLYAPGDGRVTRGSLLAETISEVNYRNSLFRKSLPVSATFFCEEHGDLPNNPVVQNNFLTALISEVAQ